MRRRSFSAAVSFARWRKNNERLMGFKMKKIVLLLLVASLLTVLPGCSLLEKVGIGGNKEVTKICEIANQSVPTTVITSVSFVTNKNESLAGHYTTKTDGTNMIFTFNCERFATPAESIELGDDSRKIVSVGTVNYKDGVFFSAEGDEWRPGSGTSFDLKFNVDKNLFKEASVSEDGAVLTCKVAKENLPAIIGTDLNAIGDAEITLATNGVNLTRIEIVCSTANGKFTINTSYTYNRQDLFPEIEEAPENN